MEMAWDDIRCTVDEMKWGQMSWAEIRTESDKMTCMKWNGSRWQWNGMHCLKGRMCFWNHAQTIANLSLANLPQHRPRPICPIYPYIVFVWWGLILETSDLVWYRFNKHYVSQDIAKLCVCDSDREININHFLLEPPFLSHTINLIWLQGLVLFNSFRAAKFYGLPSCFRRKQAETGLLYIMNWDLNDKPDVDPHKK